MVNDTSWQIDHFIHTPLNSQEYYHYCPPQDQKYSPFSRTLNVSKLMCLMAPLPFQRSLDSSSKCNTKWNYDGCWM